MTGGATGLKPNVPWCVADEKEAFATLHMNGF